MAKEMSSVNKCYYNTLKKSANKRKSKEKLVALGHWDTSQECEEVRHRIQVTYLTLLVLCGVVVAY